MSLMRVIEMGLHRMKGRSHVRDKLKARLSAGWQQQDAGIHAGGASMDAIPVPRCTQTSIPTSTPTSAPASLTTES